MQKGHQFEGREKVMSILFENDEANIINDDVKSKISPNLFVFCNYEPTPKITDDICGLFLLKVSNFYKLLVDSGWVVKKLGYIYSGKESSNSKFLPFSNKDVENIYKIVRDLRTGFFHNISDKNGDNLVINHIKGWFDLHTKKDGIDYKECIEAIDGDAETIIDVCKKFVECVEKMSDADREAAIERWKSVIIEHYTQKQDMFFNMLRSYYFSKHPEITSQQWNKKAEGYRIVLSYFTYDLKQYNDKIKNIPSTLKETIKLKDNYSIESRTVGENRAKYLFDSEDINLLYPKDDNEKKKLVDKFFENELENAINDILKIAPECSLLPQNIFNEVFDKTKTKFKFFNCDFARFDFT